MLPLFVFLDKRFKRVFRLLMFVIQWHVFILCWQCAFSVMTLFLRVFSFLSWEAADGRETQRAGSLAWRSRLYSQWHPLSHSQGWVHLAPTTSGGQEKRFSFLFFFIYWNLVFKHWLIIYIHFFSACTLFLTSLMHCRLLWIFDPHIFKPIHINYFSLLHLYGFTCNASVM